MATKKCMQCGGTTRMAKGGTAKKSCPPGQHMVNGICTPKPLSSVGAKIGVGTVLAGAAGMIGTAIKNRRDKKKAEKIEAAAKAKASTAKSQDTTKLEKKQKGGMPSRVLGPAKKPFAAGIPFFTGSGQTGPEYMQKGGGFAPNRPVQTSCKNGTVRDASGRCVMERKMAKGGFPDLNKDGKVTQADVLKGRGVFKKGGAVKPSAGLSSKQKTTVAKKASAGKDIGKKGKMFDKVAAKAGGGEKGKRIAAAAMWKNIKRG